MLTQVKRKLVWDSGNNSSSNQNSQNVGTIKMASKLSHNQNNLNLNSSSTSLLPSSIQIKTNYDVFKTPSLPTSSITRLQPVVAGFLIPSSTSTPPSSPLPGSKRRAKTSQPLITPHTNTASRSQKQLAKSPSISMTQTNVGSQQITNPICSFQTGIKEEEQQQTAKTRHRYETSLGQLTKKFIDLLQKAPDGVSHYLYQFNS